VRERVAAETGFLLRSEVRLVGFGETEESSRRGEPTPCDNAVVSIAEQAKREPDRSERATYPLIS
jgi:hypothetical protein